MPWKSAFATTGLASHGVQRQAVPAVLHDQADRRGNRARPLDQLRHRDPTAWRHDHRADSRQGEFTEFTIRLPRSQQPVVTEAAS